MNGTLWDFPVDEISATVTLPDDAKILQQSCYTGSYGTATSNCSGQELSQHKIEWHAQKLDSNQGLTIAVGFSKGVFTPPPPPGFTEKYGVLTALTIGGFFLLGYFFVTWQKYGVDPQKPVVYPQFNAPQNLSPASLGYLKKEFYSDQFISAAIVNLAIKGFIKIIEKDKGVLTFFGGKKYTLEKLKDQDQTLPKEEINLMNTLFTEAGEAVSFDGEYSSKIANALHDFKASLRLQHDQFLKKGNHINKLILPILVIVALYGLGLFFSYKLSYNYTYLGVEIFLAVIMLLSGILISMFFERSNAVKIVFGLVAVGLTLLFAAISQSDNEMLESLGFYASYCFLLFGFVGMVLFQYLIKQPTAEKLQTQSLIKGFEMYLGAADEKTLQFHNPPKMNPELFEKMLPYAMVLGVEKIWGEKFQNMLKNSSLENQDYQSNWLVGGSVMKMNFAHTLTSSLSQSIASSSVQPSSSASGSGGGGFSGGGGGGGGGGGW